jgi:hypothetical protein
MKKTMVAGALALALGSVTAQAATYDVLGGTFFMQFVTPAPTVLSPGTVGLVEGSYQAADEIFAPFIFFGNPVSTYTEAPNPAPSIDLGAMTADMSSFTAFWNGTEFNQGSAAAAVTDLGGNTYRLSWNSLIVGGPFNGFTGSWTMDVAPVPLPAAVWLFGGALAGVGAIARRRKAA